MTLLLSIERFLYVDTVFNSRSSILKGSTAVIPTMSRIEIPATKRRQIMHSDAWWVIAVIDEES